MGGEGGGGGGWGVKLSFLRNLYISILRFLVLICKIKQQKKEKSGL